jgi:hypothetical protein
LEESSNFFSRVGLKNVEGQGFDRRITAGSPKKQALQPSGKNPHVPPPLK